MGMTITEKILAAHAGKSRVEPGEFVHCKVDLVMGNDITAPIAIDEFGKIGVDRVFDKDRVALVPSHYSPSRDIKAAEQNKVMREFAYSQEVEHYFEVGRGGIEHVILPEQGLVVPGDLVLGADSHTCTYGALGCFATGVGSTDLACAMALGETWLMVPPTMKFVFRGELRPYVGGKDLILYTIGRIKDDGALYRAMEFTGETIQGLEMSHRFTICNMAIEAGAKNGMILPDDITRAYCLGRARREPVFSESDPDARYLEVHEFDASKIEPQVSYPFLPSNTHPIGEARGIKIEQCVIGSCTNGRIEDLRAAAEVFRGRKVHPRVRALVFPGSQEVYRQALKEGLIEIFTDAEAAFSLSTCGPCLGGSLGVLGEGEKAISTTNRNYVGRMGHPGSLVYLANPVIAAASAVKGEIASPDDL